MSCETTPSFEVHYKSPFIGKMELKQIYSTFYGRSFLTLKDFSAEEIQRLLDFTAELKVRREENKRRRKRGDFLAAKNFVIIFEKDSTRTRCAFEVAINDEGGRVTCLNSGTHIGKKESVADTARVLGRMFDGIEYRGFSQEVVRSLADNAGVPVWNGLTDDFHPTQIIADLATLSYHLIRKGRKINAGKICWNEVKFVYVGDARNNMGNSLMIGCAKLGLNFCFLAPKKLWPEDSLLRYARDEAERSRGIIQCFEISQKAEAMKGADAVYTDVWVSMGEEDQLDERIRLLREYQVNEALMELCENEHVVFLHCLPAFHDSQTKVGSEVMSKYGFSDGLEVTHSVFESRHSAVFDQAEYRLHSIKAVICATTGELSDADIGS